MTTCTFLERYFDREAYSVIKNQETKYNVDQNHPRSGSQQERPCPSLTKQQALSADSATFSNVHVYFLLLLCFPKALRYHLTVYKHVCMVGNASISANRRICGFTHIQVCCVRKGLIVKMMVQQVREFVFFFPLCNEFLSLLCVFVLFLAWPYSFFSLPQCQQMTSKSRFCHCDQSFNGLFQRIS